MPHGRSIIFGSEAAMYINPIHAAHVALAQALALAIRTRPRIHESKAVESPDAAGPHPDPEQLILLAECAGRPYGAPLVGLLVMKQYRKHVLEANKGPPRGGPANA
jgi:hypothetical protein